MKNEHVDYFLRRINPDDANTYFETSNNSFNTDSRTLKEFVFQDKECSETGQFITYIFGKTEKIIGMARMQVMTFEDFQKEIIENQFFSADEIENYRDLPIVYMSRAGISKNFEGLGFRTMLRSFLDAHTRSILKEFLLYALINEDMHKSMIQRYGNEFLSLYKVSNRFYDKVWKWYWVILRKFSPL